MVGNTEVRRIDIALGLRIELMHVVNESAGEHVLAGRCGELESLPSTPHCYIASVLMLWTILVALYHSKWL